MKKKFYEKPSVEVVVLNQESLLNTISGNDVTATMDGTFTETDLAREATFSDDVLFLEDE